MKISNSDIPYLVSLVEKSDQLFDQCFATNDTRIIREPAGKNNSKKNEIKARYQNVKIKMKLAVKYHLLKYAENDKKSKPINYIILK